MLHILVLVVISALIAYLGDLLGTHIGKRRLSIFGLRPRITAIVIAIATGVLITLLTLLSAAMLSDNVKIALFSVEQLTREREKLASDVLWLQKERQNLQNDLNVLKDRVRLKEQELVVFQKDMPLAAIVSKVGQTREQTLASLTEFIGEVALKAKSKGLKVKEKEQLVTENISQLSKMAEYISQATEPLVIAAVANENRSVGEDLGQVRFMIRPNNLIFKAGEEIATLEIDGRQDRKQIAQTLQEFLDEINYEVVRQGMIGDPVSGKFFGDLTSEAMMSFFDLVNQIKLLNRKVNLIVIVQEDTYAAGPLNFSFQIEEYEK